MNRMMKNLGLYLILIVLVVSLVNMFITPMQQTRDVAPLSYSEFLEQVDKGNVTEVAIDGSSITGKLKDGRAFNTYAVGVGDLAKEIAARGVNVEVKPPQAAPWWSGMVSSLFPTLLLIGAWIFILYHMQGGGSKVMSFAKSKAKMFLDNRPKVTFDDVAGCDEAKEELHEVIEFLRNPRKFSALGARVPRGVLLLGHPGTGKTLLARAVAGEADVPFFSISGSDFVEMFVGVGAARVRDLFEQARKYQPCIIFIDEIDAVGRHRGAGLGGGHDEREQTLNQLLVELDGFDASTGIIVIAATNRPDILDPALLRPGRFDRQIVVDRPDFNGRLAILKVHLRDKKVDPNVNLEIIAKRTPGFVGADLANLVNESALLAARRNKKQITMEEFEEAIDRVIAGPERRSRVISPKEKRVIALHESGHALVAKLLPDCDPVHKVSIIPRGHQALGYTMQLPEEDRFLISKKELLNQICVLLGGRVTEELKSDDITTGSQNDLERATQIARKMVTEFGMSERLGPVRLGRKQHEIFLGRDIVEDRNYSEEIAYAIDQEVRRIIDDCYELVRDLLVKHDSVLEKIAEVLLEKEVLEGEELDSLINEKLDEVTNRSEGDADAESVAAAQAVEKKTSLQLEPRIDPA
ncbi:membrane protease FtsH catalytic subunit [Acetomicrobium thermoterrenum DSM 13490]|uniref:ATP-dependent zinc metalloprotease FtsH n=1 Tax=Acetomicrobium thermoterrenum DSM 13490 TaxID=1120987 RepID=A0A1H3EWB5_9BACT|nr:ATP-dependent zinc metalloprotease FtsH [Acetomicrobium thermoterrenum]SDX82214.1 membrane protease FtsH catalytic subunit [Acetomicrobium thermoterrenum DSM 13490]